MRGSSTRRCARSKCSGSRTAAGPSLRRTAVPRRFTQSPSAPSDWNSLVSGRIRQPDRTGARGPASRPPLNGEEQTTRRTPGDRRANCRSRARARRVVHTSDTDFLRFPGLRWLNPLTASAVRRRDMTDADPNRVWERGWAGPEMEQLERLARLPLASKIQWLEDAARVVAGRSRAAQLTASGRRRDRESQD